VDNHYDDGGFTGGNMERPALKRLMTDIDAGKVDCVVVYKVDRLSRSLLDFAKMMETFERHRVAFVSVTQQFNTTTSTLLRGNVRSTGSRLGNRFGSLLKGLLHCGPCGCRMSPTHATKNRQLRYRYYVCTRAQQRGRKSCPNKSLSAEPTERFVVERLRELGANSDALARLRAGDAQRLAELERSCQAAKAVVDRCDRGSRAASPAVGGQPRLERQRCRWPASGVGSGPSKCGSSPGAVHRH
jgi:hypothetical protein